MAGWQLDNWSTDEPSVRQWTSVWQLTPDVSRDTWSADGRLETWSDNGNPGSQWIPGRTIDTCNALRVLGYSDSSARCLCVCV